MNARHVSSVALLIAVSLAVTTLARGQVTGTLPGGQAAQPRPGMPQPRDPRTGPQTGTASLSGRVSAADTGAPLRRVQVRVGGQELRGMRGAITDADGRYVVANLPAGRYSISFMKGGFAMVAYGQKRPNQPGTMVDVADGQKLENLDVRLTRGGVIAGRIVDDFGEPIVDARVQVMRLGWMNGRRRAIMAGRGDQTNDRGEYRLWGLGPGDYLVMAVSMDRQMFVEPTTALDAPDSSGFAPTYYPGTASADEAQKVAVAAGEEVGSVDFALAVTRVVRVSGTAMTSDGRPMTSATVMMFPRTPMEGGMMMPQGGRTDSNGAFVIPNVAPGEYALQTRDERGPGRQTEGEEAASATLTVGSEDVKNVMLVATRGVRVTGRVVFEGAAPTAALKENLRVFMPGVDNEPMMMFGRGGGDPQVAPDGKFEVRGITGRRSFAVSAGPPWVLKAARIGGTDVLDSGYEFGKEDVNNVELVLTSRSPTLSGSVTGDNNTPAKDYVVLAYSTDEAAWVQQSFRRGFGLGRPDQNGTYKITGLRPGSYYVVALAEMPEDLGNPDLFKVLKEGSKRVTLQDGESERLDLVLQQMPGM
jgi:carboxypeptidase family protein